MPFLSVDTCLPSCFEAMTVTEKEGWDGKKRRREVVCVHGGTNNAFVFLDSRIWGSKHLTASGCE